MKMAIKWLSGCLTILLAAACQPSITQTKMASSPKPRVASEPVQTIQTACKNLHKVVDIDDLLKQMYDNLDSQCLFEMPTAELEKIWGIRIFDYTGVEFQANEVEAKKWQTIFKQESQFYETAHSLYIKKINAKTLSILQTKTHAKLFHHYGGSLSKGQFPTLLPPFHQAEIPPDNFAPVPPTYINNDYPAPPPTNTLYNIESKYYWKSNNGKIQLILRTHFLPVPSDIIFLII